MNILDTIVEQKKRELERMPDETVSVAQLKAARLAQGELRDFVAALRQPKSGSIALIAEIKKASPSAGVICQNFDPVRIAREYEKAGASCLSVLTDEKFFQGLLSYLLQIRQAVSLPLLRKDFIIDARQIHEAALWGADAILLIAAILDDAQLARLHRLATEAGLAVLVEVHDERELDSAMAIGPELIGINNRDLKTFKVDLSTTARLAQRLQSASSKRGPIPLLVAESGINSRSDVDLLANYGARAILAGETLMRAPDIAAKVDELLGSVPET